MSIPVSVPIFSYLHYSPSKNLGCINDLRRAVVQDIRLNYQNITLSQVSLRTLGVPVPLEPHDTLHKRVLDSARDDGYTTVRVQDAVCHHWSDTDKIHVYVDINRGPVVQAAENLHQKIWGKDFKTILKDVRDHSGAAWKCLLKEDVDSLGMATLHYNQCGLLIRAEYEIAFEELCSKKDICRGVVLTGQHGSGKTCFLYYALLRLLCQKTPVAFELMNALIVFQDDNVYEYPRSAEGNVIPEGSWALSGNSIDQAGQPCNAFLTAAEQNVTWLVHAASPSVTEYNWQERLYTQTYVMDYFSLHEMTALGNVLSVSPACLKPIYKKWGPSTRTCLLLSEMPTLERAHELAIIRTANWFVLNPEALSLHNFSATQMLHKLFAISPEGKDEEGRGILVADIATDQINAIVSFAVANATAQERTNFYNTMSKEPRLSVSLGKIFERFVLTWLTSDDEAQLPCTSVDTHSPRLTISACEWKDTQKTCGSLDDLRNLNTTEKTLPFCFLPSASVDAIIFTDHSIITIQITNAQSHDTTETVFRDIKTKLPKNPKRDAKPRTWCHVFITDHEQKARALRRQPLTGLSEDFHIYSAVFGIGQFQVKSEHMRRLDEARRDTDEVTNQKPADEIMDDSEVSNEGMAVD